MPVVVTSKREYDFTGTDLRGDPCAFPRDVRNSVFVQAFGFQTKIIDQRENQYMAFPFVIKIGTSIVGIYSDGDAHAQADRQIMFRTDNYGQTYSYVTFLEFSTGVFDFSLLTGLIPNGGTEVFKIWAVSNVGGTFSATTVSPIVYGGLSYNMWSPVRTGIDGVFYRTGYALNGSVFQSAVFQSSDKKVWTGKSVSFSNPALSLGESDIVETSSGNWLSVCREDNGAGNPLYYATSTNNMSTWSAPVAYATTAVNGRQPFLLKMSDGSLILGSGDRTGGGGYAGSGDQVSMFDTTGVTVFKTTDTTGATWGFRTRIAPTYSTDGGQPSIVETTPGRVIAYYYSRKSIGTSPFVGSSTFNVENL